MRMQPPPQQKSFSFRGERAKKPAPDRQNDQLFTHCARQGHSDTPAGSSTLGITARHARQAAILVGHVLLAAARTLADPLCRLLTAVGTYISYLVFSHNLYII